MASMISGDSGASARARAIDSAGSCGPGARCTPCTTDCESRCADKDGAACASAAEVALNGYNGAPMDLAKSFALSTKVGVRVAVAVSVGIREKWLDGAQDLKGAGDADTGATGSDHRDVKNANGEI